MTLRGGDAFPGTAGLDWRVYGSRGELRLTAPGPFLQMGYADTVLEVRDYLAGGSAQTVELEKDEFDREEGGKGMFGLADRNVARVYKGLAKGEVNASFEDAVELHRLLDGMYVENGIQA